MLKQCKSRGKAAQINATEKQRKSERPETTKPQTSQGYGVEANVPGLSAPRQRITGPPLPATHPAGPPSVVAPI